MTVGVAVSWTSPVLPQLESNSTSSFHLSSNEASWVGSLLGIGVLAAALPTGYLAGRFGLKKCVIGLIFPQLLFAILIVFSKDVYTLCIARFFYGMATGGICVVSPMYISEISQVSFRATLGSLFECFIYVGVILVAICGAYVNYKILTVMAAILALVLGIMFLFFPESPTYLLKNNQRTEAENALKFYRSESFDATLSMIEIRNSINDVHRQLDIKTALRSKRVIRGIVASTGLTIFQKFCGIDCIVFYTVNIFQVTQTGIDAYTSSIILTSVQLTTAIVNVFVVELANRRVFLFISCIGMGISLAMLGLYFQLKEYNVYFIGMDALPLVSLIVHAISFSTGFGPVLWLINGEVFAPDVKGLGNGIAMTTNWTLLSVVTKLFPLMMIHLGPYATFYFFSCSMVVCVIFIIFFVPETRGKTLEQIQIELSA